MKHHQKEKSKHTLKKNTHLKSSYFFHKRDNYIELSFSNKIFFFKFLKMINQTKVCFKTAPYLHQKVLIVFFYALVLMLLTKLTKIESFEGVLAQKKTV